MSNLAAQELQSFVRRIEALDDEIRALNSDKSEVFKEVKGAGFTAKTLRKVVAARRMDAADRDEADAEFELYWNSVHGIEADHVRAHVENIEEFPHPVAKVEEEVAGKVLAASDDPASREVDDADRQQLASSGVSGEGQGASVALPTPSTVTTFTPKPLRPYCLSPGNSCGGMGKKHCLKCEKARDEQQGVA